MYILRVVARCLKYKPQVGLLLKLFIQESLLSRWRESNAKTFWLSDEIPLPLSWLNEGCAFAGPGYVRHLGCLLFGLVFSGDTSTSIMKHAIAVSTWWSTELFVLQQYKGIYLPWSTYWAYVCRYAYAYLTSENQALLFRNENSRNEKLLRSFGTYCDLEADRIVFWILCLSLVHTWA